jgi:hypothetical protein
LNENFWNILQPFGVCILSLLVIFCGHLVNAFFHFGIFYQEKSGSPATNIKTPKQQQTYYCPNEFISRVYIDA